MINAVRFGVQADAKAATDFLLAAKAAEAAGLYALFVPDHPASCVSPFVALAAAATVTGHIRLGTYVLNSGVHHPFQTANDLNTLDLLSDGRAILGVGAGHTPAEWTQRGLRYPSAVSRVDRMIKFTELVRSLSHGDLVNSNDDHFTLIDAAIRHPAARQVPIPLLIGGNGPRVRATPRNTTRAYQSPDVDSSERRQPAERSRPRYCFASAINSDTNGHWSSSPGFGDCANRDESSGVFAKLHAE